MSRLEYRRNEILEEARVESIAMVTRMRRLEWFGDVRRNRKHQTVADMKFLVLSYVYSKQPIFGLTQKWFRELYCGVHDKLHISSADWWDLLLPLA